MIKISANLGFLWQELSLIDRIYAAKREGFFAVEFHWPYDTDPQDVRRVLDETGLPALALNTETGNLDIGEYGLSAVPGRESEAKSSIDKAIAYAVTAGIKNIHPMAGTSGDGESAINVYIDNLVYASKIGLEKGIGVIIEPINRIDRPGYTLHKVSQALEIIEKIKRAHGDTIANNIRLMYDCYHVQRTEGDLLTRLQEALPVTVHIQIAATPNRAEPDQGEINYNWLFEQIDAMGYDGYIGAEYIPADTTDSGLAWFEQYRMPDVLKTKSIEKQATIDELDNMRVYRNLTQSQLDAEYNNLAKVSNSAEHLKWYADTSKAYRQTATCELDIAYGVSEMEKLDIFFPNGLREGENRPVHVFFHGGYWRALDKSDFSYVAKGFEGSDAICVVVNYALAPNVSMGELVEQCRQSMLWVWHNIKDFGGANNNITISGHSAGGHLVAMMMATDWPKLDHRCSTDLVKAGVSISGLFDLEPIRLCFLNESLKLDNSMASNNSPLFLTNRSRGELISYFGALEGPEFRSQSDRLAEKWSRTTSVIIEGHDHFTFMHDMYVPDSVLSKKLRQQLGVN